MIKGILLDMDGTIVDAFSPIVRALNLTFAEYGLPEMSELEVRRHTGKGEASMIALFGDKRAEAGRRFLEIHDEDYLKRITPITGAEELLGWLAGRGIPSAIVTSKSQSRAEAQIDVLGWNPFIQAIIGKIDGRPEKPDPTPVLLGCTALGIKPAEAVMIGDGIADMQAAARAGCTAIGISDSFSEGELSQAGATHCFDSLSEVHAWLKTAIS